MRPHHADLPTVFSALADPTRLAILNRLMDEGELPVGTLSRDLPVTPPAVTHHVRVLQDAGLVERRAVRQQRLIRAAPDALSQVDDWLARYRAFWTGALDRLEEEMRKRKDTKKP